MRWVFLGPPGAGKGTQAKKVVAEFGIDHVSTGDLLRSEVSEGTDLGRKAKAFMDRGVLVPDDLVVAMVVSRISGLDSYLLDGFPRTLVQAEAFEKHAGAEAVEKVLHFDLDDEAIVERLSGRRTCSRCQAMYHERFLPPSQPSVCDACGGELYQRDDDRPETIRHRTEVARRESGPVLEFYEKRGCLVRIDASRAPDEVYEKLRAVLPT